MSINLGSTYKEVVDEINTSSKRIDDLENGGGTAFITDETLILSESGVLSVNTTDVVEDSELPITAKAVYAVLGDINTLLDEI